MIKSLAILLVSCSVAIAAGPSGLGGTPLSGSAVSSNSIVQALGFVPASSSGSVTTPAQVTNIVATLSPTNGDTRDFSFLGNWTLGNPLFVTNSLHINSVNGLVDAIIGLSGGTMEISSPTLFDSSITGSSLVGTGNRLLYANAAGRISATNLLVGLVDYKLNYQTQDIRFTNTTGGDLIIQSDGSSLLLVQGLNTYASLSGNHIEFDQPTTNTAVLAANGGLVVANGMSVSGASSFANPVTVTGSGTNWFSYTMFTNFMGVSNVNFLAGVNINTNGDIKTTGTLFANGISNGIYGIKISSTTGVGIGMANEGYGPGSLELLGALVANTDISAGASVASGSSSYVGIGNRTAFRADGNGQLRIFAANVSTAGGVGADVFLGTTTATNGFITVTNSAQILSSITFPLTTVKWTNNFGMNIVLYIDNSGVTGTSVSKNNQQIFSSLVGDMTICLKPGDYFAVAYTIGTPVARWEPQ